MGPTPATAREIKAAHEGARDYLIAHPLADGVAYEIDIMGHGRPDVFRLTRGAFSVGKEEGTLALVDERAGYWEEMARQLRAKLATLREDYDAVPHLCCDTCRSRFHRADQRKRQARGENIEVTG